jgi:hypothetical protein
LLGFAPIDEDDKKGSHLFTALPIFAAFKAATYSLLYTDSADYTKINGTIGLGDKSNVSIGQQGLSFSKWDIEIGHEWLRNTEANEIQILEDNGVTCYSNNRVGNLKFGDDVTIYTVDAEGNPDLVFHFVEAEESVSSFLTYTWNRVGTEMAYKRMRAGAMKAEFVILMSSIYNVCSGIEIDMNDNRSYEWLDASGSGQFLRECSATYQENFLTGHVDMGIITTTILSQLRSIFLVFKFRKA